MRLYKKIKATGDSSIAVRIDHIRSLSHQVISSFNIVNWLSSSLLKTVKMTNLALNMICHYPFEPFPTRSPFYEA